MIYSGNWTKITIDLTEYTGWENDIGIMLELTPSTSTTYEATYCYQFRHGSDLYPDVFQPGDSSKCVVAIDDVKLTVTPATGK